MLSLGTSDAIGLIGANESVTATADNVNPVSLSAQSGVFLAVFDRGI